MRVSGIEGLDIAGKAAVERVHPGPGTCQAVDVFKLLVTRRTGSRTFKAVSAIWSTDVDEAWVIGNIRDLEVVAAEGPEPPIKGVENWWHFGGRSPPRQVVFDGFQ
jgi:hypothetical protein